MYSGIKKDERIEKGPLHLFNEIKNVKNQITPEEQDLLLRNIAWNSYMAHPENIILAMIS